VTSPGKSRFWLTIARDVCTTIFGIAAWAYLVSNSSILLIAIVAAFICSWRINSALRTQQEPLTPLQKRWLFTFECFVAAAFPVAVLIYALSTQAVLAWIVFGSFCLIMPAALYGGYLDLFINQT
jgi:hypothetical protein